MQDMDSIDRSIKICGALPTTVSAFWPFQINTCKTKKLIYMQIDCPDISIKTIWQL